MRTTITSFFTIAILMAVGSVAMTKQSAAAEHKEVVAYRLVQTKTMHLDDEPSAQQYRKTLLNLGCEARLSGHAGHFDLAYRCPEWESAQFASHQSAHKWERWLRSLGFEVVHRHDH